MKRIWSWIKTIWKDPVWSKVISVGILAIIAFVWAWYEKKTPKGIYDLIIQVLNFPIPLYFIFSAVGLLFLIRLLLKFFKKKADPLYDEQVGNYTFKELCQVLQKEKIEGQTVIMEWNREKPIDADLLSQFITFAPTLNQGVTFEQPRDSGYMYALFCPKMMTYGLVDKIAAKHHSGIDMEIYQLSELGKRFLALWDKHCLRVDKEQSTNR